MNQSGVKLKALSLSIAMPLSISSSSSNSTLFYGRLLFSHSYITAARKSQKPLSHSHSLSVATPRFSSFCTLSHSNSETERANGSSLPYGSGLTVEQQHLLQVVLVSPQIPGNTGCIARTCAASGVKLHLVEPLGFRVDDAKLKRAGLDYWPYVVVKVHPSWADFQDYFSRQEGEKRLLAFTKRGTAIHSDFSYKPGDWLVFGSETSGLPPEALADCKSEKYGGATVKIPMVDTYVRCLNLSVSVGIAVYEAARQLNYEQLQCSSPETCIDSENSFITEDIFA